ncbi:response regulator transcription factor [Pantoea sp. B65]
MLKTPHSGSSILLVEDDVRLAQMIVPYLAPYGFDIVHSQNARHAKDALNKRKFDLILLDLMLGDADGLDVCRYIRTSCEDDPAIIMVTGRGDPTDRIIGLEIGADDYLPKPFEPRELLARIRAVLRRMVKQQTADSSGMLIRSGPLEINTAARTVTLRQKNCPLTALQFDLLLTLARNAGRVLNRDQLWQSIRGEAYESFDRAIDVHIGRIRQAIEDDPRTPKQIITVRGIGYVFSRLPQE